MLIKNKILAVTLTISFIGSCIGSVSLASATKDYEGSTVYAEEDASNTVHKYDDLYELRAEITQLPKTPYEWDSSPDFSELRLSVYIVGKDGNEQCTIEDASLENVKEKFDVQVVSAPGGGGAFVVIISAYSTALTSTITTSTDFSIPVIEDTLLVSLRSEIVSLPTNNVKNGDAELDLSGLAISVWEVYKDGTEQQVFTATDLDQLKENYDVNVSYRSTENDGEGICVITIASHPYATVVQTTCEFTYYIGDSNPLIQGDVNNDGDFNVTDVVLLQKWLLNVPDTHLVNWIAADLCEDDVLNVFDLCLMKRDLINEMSESQYPVENPEVIDEFTPCTKEIGDIQDPEKFYIVIKCQYSDPNRIWSIDDFQGIDNIESVLQSYQESPYRTILEVRLKDQVAEKMLSMIHSIEELGLEEIKEFQFLNYTTGVPD